MANITLMGASYENVPAVELPRTSGGFATFYENTGLIIPPGWGYYNGYLLPQIPFADGYNYAFIRVNPTTSMYDLVLGTSQWGARSNASLDSWALEFSNQASVGSRQYSIPISGDTTTASDWGDFSTSKNYYGTTNGRKVIFANHDIIINASGNILYKHGIALLPSSE